MKCTKLDYILVVFVICTLFLILVFTGCSKDTASADVEVGCVETTDNPCPEEDGPFEVFY